MNWDFYRGYFTHLESEIFRGVGLDGKAASFSFGEDYLAISIDFDTGKVSYDLMEDGKGLEDINS